ncbi:UDP-N-acetylmuramoyl-tripeptide--D-alanyl-D-alanine ligase [Fictibacillus enclensis]|uniref:UDP-N-acetylmuramoyl-tripeptide--D-alanyl-D-alanine ligase n=1 Tax=Fictibacillus enclensis TaxID=1017270 RepID=A0A0V8JCU3_9BACL|nr:UDP-N-acetylmuramoyl-tripeptide--D-alanyl-D-alanine ligase [Fictibacillus enclensis]KSU84983.1 UDP-N-acetylmuramoylalanyl-D-glutamate--2,6-diaminopimelate ligase [Fictibacillus enclensis]SCB88916.1 UDP-N-acetylmuramoyl-tripeptide--D-alanyl-D-alanine ligase [Fictibacillus enclensis]
MKLDLKELIGIAASTRGNIESTVIQEVTKDSRVNSPQSLYIPIAGEKFDGHNFLLQAIEQGAVASLWQEGTPIPQELDPAFPLLIVKDTIEALQQAARVFLKKVKPVVIGVTGSNGKTTTKDLLEAVVSTSFKTHKTKGNYNNHIGLPLTILSMDNDTQVIILEMGMSNFGEISLLSKLSQPDLAIVTNIGESHIEYLGSREGIAKAKLEIKDGLKEGGLLIVDGDEPLLSHLSSPNVLKCGYDEDCTVKIVNQEGDEDGFTFGLEGESTIYSLPLLGTHNVKNAAYAIAVGHYLNIEDSAINEGLKNITLTNMRLEKYRGQHGALLINDAYNASPTSMIAAIQAVKDLQNYKKKVLVLGDMYELGPSEEEMHRKVAAHIDETISEVITVGEKGKWIGEEIKKKNIPGQNVSVFLTKEEAAGAISSLLSEDTVVLFKASRGMALESIVKPFIDDVQEAGK